MTQEQADRIVMAYVRAFWVVVLMVLCFLGAVVAVLGRGIGWW